MCTPQDCTDGEVRRRKRCMNKLSQWRNPIDHSYERNRCSIDEQRIRKMKQICPIAALERFAYETLGNGGGSWWQNLLIGQLLLTQNSSKLVLPRNRSLALSRWGITNLARLRNCPCLHATTRHLKIRSCSHPKANSATKILMFPLRRE
jgi:hypothetical protein